MHTRKLYLIYPPNYQPNQGRIRKVYSRRQALRAVLRSPGSSVCVVIRTFPQHHTNWDSSRLDFIRRPKRGPQWKD